MSAEAGASPDAQLWLAFRAMPGPSTALVRRRVRYPFSVTAPVAGRRDALVVVQSSSGGLYGDEALVQRVDVGASATVELRFPSAMVVNAATSGQAAEQSIELQVEAGGRLRFLPRPLILLPGAMIRQRMLARLGTGASLTLRDGFMLHDPSVIAGARGARSIDSVLRIEDASGRPLAIDRFQADDAVLAAATPGVTGRFKAFGALWHVSPGADDGIARLRASLREAFAADQRTMVSASTLARHAGVVIRVASVDGGGLDAALLDCQALLDAA